MTKNIILLSDGTGNAAGSPHKTNVWRLYKAIKDCEIIASKPVKNAKTAVNTKAQKKQIAFYDDGVGTSSFIVKRLLGQAFGWGLKRNVKDLYRNLCQVYNEGDKIFILGYSRGAYTARILAALIANQGIITRFDDEIELDKEIEGAYDDFRHEIFVPSLLTFPIWLFRKLTKEERLTNNRKLYNPKDKKPLIEFIGVWDTVDAYGAPIDEITRGWDMIIWPLTAKDRNLSPAIKSAYHALALDERRKAFEPVLWNEYQKQTDDDRQETSYHVTNIEQVWFPGVHANVGGGYPDDSLAYTSLNWMIEKCKKHDLRFEVEITSQYTAASNLYGPLYDNRSGIGNIYRFEPRKIETLCNASKPGLVNRFLGWIGNSKAVSNEVRIDCPKIHHSVFDRIKYGGDAYAPINLPEKYCVVDENGNVIPLDKNANTDRFETSDQSEQRRIIQSDAWNKVWFLKFLFLTLMLSLLGFVLGPYVMPQDLINSINDFGDTAFGTLGELFRVLPIYLGKILGFGFINGWAEAYSKLPYIFVAFLLLISGIIFLGLRVKSKLNSTMRQYWSHIHKGENPLLIKENSRGILARFLDSYRDTENETELDDNKIKVSLADGASALIRLVLEFIAALFFLLIVIWAVWKISFTVVDGLGGICTPTEKHETKEGETLSFDPSNPCFDTGFPAKEGAKYQIEFTVPNEWTDETIEADSYGFLKPAPSIVKVATPYRRHLIRIGGYMYDRYYTNEDDTKAAPVGEQPSIEEGYIRVRKETNILKFKARKTGRIYFYLNDAVSPWPFAPWVFYDNNCEANCKKATLIITEVK